MKQIILSIIAAVAIVIAFYRFTRPDEYKEVVVSGYVKSCETCGHDISIPEPYAQVLGAAVVYTPALQHHHWVRTVVVADGVECEDSSKNAYAVFCDHVGEYFDASVQLIYKYGKAIDMKWIWVDFASPEFMWED